MTSYGQLERGLRQLAKDIREHFSCNCTDRNGDTPIRCRCEGDGTDHEGNVPGIVGCWHCQSRAALRRPRRTPVAR